MQLAPQYWHARYGRGIAHVRLGRTAKGQTDLAAAEAMNENVAAMYRGYRVSP